MTKIVVLGASGMLGNAMFRLLSAAPGLEVIGAVRASGSQGGFPEQLRANLIAGIDVENIDSLTRLLASARPDVVVNCVGLVKQLADADDPLAAIPINSLLPHRLARLCEVAGARLVHISTDCVFAGTRGNYLETDFADAGDLYGRSKYLGELHNASNAITLRTSIIGRELRSAHGLVDWFLAQQGEVKGFTRAIFSGLPTVELAEIVRDHIIPRPDLHGLYHVSAAPISKHDLLTLIATEYGKDISIVPDAELVLDRSLVSAKFNAATGYVAAGWPSLIGKMHSFG
ncbi:dTDP-4-dehydrorhamnose reductase family protein [Herbaspirillum sp. alder98]|uniref:dTDP-4-dehydrorhamnose reductase family protein n=1 Tax=Herbaspirillum sp. alder98 TaxID=2913096 RepID=UPI001CD81B5E|nr:SDR family oxidoreductase [Herbaspirillum sp. alder98]MCA1324317.1 SDR family oxidoreductase [Herbaspirillum sp. alder98]